MHKQMKFKEAEKKAQQGRWKFKIAQYCGATGCKIFKKRKWLMANEFLLYSGIRIWWCCRCGVVYSYGLDLISGPGMSICRGCCPQKGKKCSEGKWGFLPWFLGWDGGGETVSQVWLRELRGGKTANKRPLGGLMGLRSFPARPPPHGGFLSQVGLLYHWYHFFWHQDSSL